MYVYLKAKPKPPKRKKNRFVSLMSAAFFMVGVLMIGQAVLPIASWYLLVLPGVSETIISPLASTFPGVVRAAETDSYSPAKWFVGPTPSISPVITDLKIYTITIPKIHIKSATVEIDGKDLKKTLVAWPTSVPPGTFGNNIIFGHSELPQFASPGNYSGIFTEIMSLDDGDEIYLDYDQVRYRYLVVDKKVVEPTDLSVLEQRFDAGYVTLITCVPPGTIWKRGVIRARLVGL